mmetsp:Transcript_8755/g.20415  ORF Transcript_8755/g.20415 Transcript_8755/m.20415 type:complete len:618 (-) Transcript_8755:1920-3773(-)
MVCSRHYPMLETVFNLGCAVVIGIVARWMFGLFRSLRLSQKNGPCCSPYRGDEDEGSRSAGAFERLLACLLLKQAGDDAGQPIMSMVVLMFLMCILDLARNVSRRLEAQELLLSRREKDEGDEDEAVKESEFADPMAAKRFVVGLMTTLATYMFLTTPVLLDRFGLESMTAASEEWAARVMLLGNLVGVNSLPTFDEAPVQIQALSRVFFAGISLLWGYAVASLMLPVEETARNAATVMTSSATNGSHKKTPDEIFAIVNSRMMLVVQALIPLVVTLTFFFSARFEGTSGSYNPNASFTKRHLQNGAGYIRLMSAWSFLGACSYTTRALLQSYLDEAGTIAGEGVKKVRRRFDPFNDRYQTLVSTAARISVFPAFVLALLAMGHLLGGDWSARHPGVGHISQPRHAPRDQITSANLGILPGYNGPYLHWLSKAQNPHHLGTNNALLHMAAVSQSQWGVDRKNLDLAHTKVVDFVGGDSMCYPPDARTVKAIRRHVNFLLDTDDDGSTVDSIVTQNALTGRELISHAPEVKVSLIGAALGQSGATCKEEKSEDEVCREEQSPSFVDVFYTGLSHRLMTPSIMSPLLHLMAFLVSIFWLFFYTAKMIKFWLALRFRPRK